MSQHELIENGAVQTPSLPSNSALARMALSSPKQETVVLNEAVPPVAIITQGPLAWASSRFRGAWLEAAAPGLFRWYPPDKELAKMAAYKVLVFQKRFGREDYHLAKAAKERGVKIIIDLTDPLWWFDPPNVYAMIALADAVSVSSEGLKTAVEQGKQAARVVHIADRVQPSFHPTIAQHGPREVVTLVWFGLAANRISLMGALPVLAYVANMGSKFRLRIIDDQPTERVEVQGPFEVEHVPWALETIHAQLTACDIAVLPPYPGPWGTLKSNNKEVTAWWCGLPTTDGYDPSEVAKLIESADIRKSAGKHNRAMAEAKYDIRDSVDEWKALLKELGVKL